MFSRVFIEQQAQPEKTVPVVTFVLTMCGRTSCALRKDHLLRACQYRNTGGTYECPTWKDMDESGKYQPSYNVPPRSYSAVLIHGSQLARVRQNVGPSDESSGVLETERVAAAMFWTLVPSWWDPAGGREMAASTFNCRIEGCLTRPFFRTAFEAGRRCVALAEGYYEWKNVPKSGKQPYFVYAPQPEGISLTDRLWEDGDIESLYQEGRWNGPRLLTMAAIFDVAKSGTVGFSVLTMEAPRYMSWLHSRVPVILDGEEAVSSWLDPGRSSRELRPTISNMRQPDDVGLFWACVVAAVCRLIVAGIIIAAQVGVCEIVFRLFATAVKEVISTREVEFPTNLQWHPVSSTVGKVSNKGIECVLPLPEKKQHKSTLMDKWLNRGSLNPATGEGASPMKK